MTATRRASGVGICDELGIILVTPRKWSGFDSLPSHRRSTRQ